MVEGVSERVDTPTDRTRLCVGCSTVVIFCCRLTHPIEPDSYRDELIPIVSIHGSAMLVVKDRNASDSECCKRGHDGESRIDVSRSTRARRSRRGPLFDGTDDGSKVGYRPDGSTAIPLLRSTEHEHHSWN